MTRRGVEEHLTCAPPSAAAGADAQSAPQQQSQVFSFPLACLAQPGANKKGQHTAVICPGPSATVIQLPGTHRDPLPVGQPCATEAQAGTHTHRGGGKQGSAHLCPGTSLLQLHQRTRHESGRSGLSHQVLWSRRCDNFALRFRAVWEDEIICTNPFFFSTVTQKLCLTCVHMKRKTCAAGQKGSALYEGWEWVFKLSFKETTLGAMNLLVTTLLPSPAQVPLSSDGIMQPSLSPGESHTQRHYLESGQGA